ncbi:hypothetical protein N7522_009293 [Penicillium canescens]|nr:hypothetical protein N7522_009293 [Penicillium canescens]
MVFPFKLFDRDSAIDARSGGWGLTLHWALPALRELLPEHLVERFPETFVNKKASALGDTGRFQFFDLKSGAALYDVPAAERIRVSRVRLRQLLTTGINVQWSKNLQNIESSGDTITAHFADGTSCIGRLLVACDGSRSRTREILYPDLEMNPLPVQILGASTLYTAEEMGGAESIDPFIFQGSHPDSNVFLFFSFLDTPGNFDTSSKDRYHCQVIVSWADSKGISVPGDNAERIALMKNLTDSWSEPFRSLVHKLPDDVEVRSIRIEDWMFQPGRTHAHPRAVLMGDSAHTMTMYRGEGANNAIVDVLDLVNRVDMRQTRSFGQDTLIPSLAAYENDVFKRAEPSAMSAIPDKASSVRISQRQPQACRECTKRKRKCDKQIPCTRCKRLNLNCSIEVVQLRRNAVQHASEIEFLNTVLADLDSSSSPGITHVIQKVRNRISRLQTGQDLPQSEASNIDSAQQEITLTEDRIPGKLPSSTESASNQIDSSLLTAIEHLAWGRNSAGCFPHRNCACQYRKNGQQLVSSNGSIQGDGLPLGLNPNLPRIINAQKLVKFHICHVAWHHDCFHGPTFLEQCEMFWETGRYDDPLWLALYYSVLSSTVSSIQDSPKARDLVDVDLHTMQSAQQLFSAMVQTLYDCHFLSNLSIYSVQAIVISTEVAHNLGLSQLNATLFNAAVRIAECLGVHKIQDHSTKPVRNKDDWEERVEREVGKRVWCQMIIQDHFAIPFTDTYSISPMHFSTGRPMNAEDYDLMDMPISTPTTSTYVRVLVNLAELMPGLVDGLGPMNNRKPHREQYQHILQVDQKMRAVVKDIPPFLLRPDKEKEQQIPWLSIARRSLAITAAEKIIMIHRPFLFRSFHDPTYSYTRRTSVAAAMTILREHETIVREEDISIWTHTAFAITAAVIMCFEVNAIAESAFSASAQSYKEAILSARARLASRDLDVLAQRGVALIDAIFTAGSDLNTGGTSSKMMDFGQILAKFSTFSRLNLGSPSTEASPGGIPVVDSQDVIGAHFDEMRPTWGTAEDIDFDAWFNETFYSLQGPLQL